MVLYSLFFVIFIKHIYVNDQILWIWINSPLETFWMHSFPAFKVFPQIHPQSSSIRDCVFQFYGEIFPNGIGSTFIYRFLDCLHLTTYSALQCSIVTCLNWSSWECKDSLIYMINHIKVNSDLFVNTTLASKELWVFEKNSFLFWNIS